MRTFFSSVKNDRARSALSFSIIDGILWATMFGLAENYIFPFVLFFGALAVHTSIMQGASQLGISIAQLAGAKLIHAFRKRRILSVITTSIHASSFIFMAIAAVFTKNFWIMIIAYVVGAFANNVAAPGWISWMNDIIPSKIRGVYWGFRNRIINLIQFSAILVAGVALYAGSQNHSVITFACKYGSANDFMISSQNMVVLFVYVLLFGIGGVSRLGCTIPLSRQYEPKMEEEKKGDIVTLRSFLSALVSSNFGRFALFSFSLTFAVNIMAPIIPVFLLQPLGFNYLEYSIVMLAPMVTTILAISYWGRLADRYGNYRILLITVISLPLLAFGWAFIKNTWVLVVLQLFSGFVWSGFNLSNQNYIFDSIEPRKIPKIYGYFVSFNNASAFLGSITGGLLTLVTMQMHIQFFAPRSFELIFMLSGLLRVVIIFFLIRSFKEVRKVERSPKIHHFYFYLPMSNIYNRIALGIKKLQRKKGNGIGNL
jgi:MFS family permease